MQLSTRDSLRHAGKVRRCMEQCGTQEARLAASAIASLERTLVKLDNEVEELQATLANLYKDKF